MHDGYFEFHLAQTRGCFTGKQPATDDRDALFYFSHFSQGKGVANRAQINDVTQANTRYGRSHRPTAHRQASLVKLDRFAVAQDSETAVDIELGHDRIEARLDLVRLIPARIDNG